MLRAWNKSSEKSHFFSVSFSTQEGPCLQTSHCNIHWHCVLLWTKILPAFQAYFFFSWHGALVSQWTQENLVILWITCCSLSHCSPWRSVQKRCTIANFIEHMLSMPGFPLIYVKIWATKTGCSCSTGMLQTAACRITSPLSQRYQWQHLTQDLCTAGWPLSWPLILSLSGPYFQTHNHLKSCQLKRLLFWDFLGNYIKEKHWSKLSPNSILQ